MRQAICCALAFAVVTSVEVGAAEEPTRPGFAPPDSDLIGSEITLTAEDARPEEDAEAAAPIEAGFANAEVYVGQYDHVAAGTGLRNTGYGTIRLRGTPDGAKKRQAFLYLGVICETASCTPKRRAVLNGSAVSLTLIATDVPCAVPDAQVGIYRADVTAKVPVGIDADYKITGVASGVKTGSNPAVGPPGPLPFVEGATLVVIYSSSTLTPGAVYIHHGADTFATGVLYTLPLDPLPTGTTRRYTSFGAGGQPLGPGEETWIGDVNSTSYVAGPVGSGGLLKKDSDWSGDDGWYWDTHTLDVSPRIPADSSAYVVRFVPHGDCLVAAGHVLTAR